MKLTCHVKLVKYPANIPVRGHSRYTSAGTRAIQWARVKVYDTIKIRFFTWRKEVIFFTASFWQLSALNELSFDQQLAVWTRSRLCPWSMTYMQLRQQPLSVAFIWNKQASYCVDSIVGFSTSPGSLLSWLSELWKMMPKTLHSSRQLASTTSSDFKRTTFGTM